MNSLQLKFNNKISVLDYLKRSNQPLVSKVQLDMFTNKANENFDFDFNGENKFYPFEFNEILEDLDFNILVITGASGSGKSTFSKYFGEEEKLEYDNSKAIISHFNNPDEAVEKLIAVGLNSIPTWCKPRNVLSVGEGFRIDLARKLKSNCVIDEFTSTVDRNVAMSCCKSISKYIRNKNLKKCVFVSCHKDFIDVLCPDYIIDLDDECIYDAKGLPTRNFELSVYEKSNKTEIWKLFRQHHYLSAELNVACRLFVAYLDNQIVGMCAILPQPSGTINDAFKVHRLVVLPDFQGLGLGVKILEYVADLYKYHKKNFYIRTSHIKLIKYMLKSPKWYGDGKLLKSKSQNKGVVHITYAEDYNRLSTSFKYISDCIYDKNKNYDAIIFNKSISKYSKKTDYDYSLF